MNLRDRLAAIAARRQPQESPFKPWVPPTFDEVHEGSLSFGPLATTDGYGTEYSFWGGNKFTVQVETNPVFVQFSRSQPPAPATWDRELWVGLGPWSHVGRYGYFRFRSAAAGRPGTVTGSAVRE